MSRRRVYEMRRDPTLDALIILSEDTPLSPAQNRAFRAGVASFIARERIGYVVVDRTRSSDALAHTVIDAFGLVPVDRDGPFELYRPGP